jgi:hypothetical protein
MTKLRRLESAPKLQTKLLEEILSTAVSPRVLKKISKGAQKQTKMIKKISKGQQCQPTQVAKRIVEKWKRTIAQPHSDTDPASCHSWKALFHTLIENQQAKRKAIGNKCRAMYKQASKDKKKHRVKQVTCSSSGSSSGSNSPHKRQKTGGKKSLGKLRTKVKAEQKRLWSGKKMG